MYFTKMHGASNDYIYINGFEEDIESIIPHVPFLSHRHKGIGSDGVVFILPSSIADLCMRMFNSDGSEAQMCGNAIRCVGKYAFENGLINKTICTVETKAGIKSLDMQVEHNKVISVSVDMGVAIFTPKDIPVAIEDKFCLEYPLDILGKNYKISCVSMGNPHAVIFMQKEEDVEDLEIANIGSIIENHPLFPEKINVEFAYIIDKEHVRMRVWERGAGETEACGTGACAVASIAYKLGYTSNKVDIILNGGILHIEIKENQHVFMTGGATKVFEGEWHAD